MFALSCCLRCCVVLHVYIPVPCSGLLAETLVFGQNLLGPQCALDVPVLRNQVLDYVASGGRTERFEALCPAVLALATETRTALITTIALSDVVLAACMIDYFGKTGEVRM